MCGSREQDWIDPETGRLLAEPKLTPTGVKCHGCGEVAAYKAAEFGDGVPEGVRIILWDERDVDSEGKIRSKQVKRPVSE